MEENEIIEQEEQIELTPEEETLHNIIKEGLSLRTRYYEMGGTLNKENSQLIKEVCDEYHYQEQEHIKSTPKELLESLYKDLQSYYENRKQEQIISTDYYQDCEGEAIKELMQEIEEQLLEKNESKTR